MSLQTQPNCAEARPISPEITRDSPDNRMAKEIREKAKKYSSKATNKYWWSRISVKTTIVGLLKLE